ncbi:hypothetical protein COU96_00605 [Candidatus Shapirobacteria bacterium CG10_big_fil_rev_8_21_14_0_10_38_14]|uniref:Addiction module toxin, HicA family n=1 Tax=Candidatus Shapirobacteria bacterium CG10_big_fil_rev_8_21_14_0_10_38_14 TaxID=1974483 RepID=A0A2M8L611_9BACT|nr:MAG: hypothetical protein COU96_00605 [Candidatus Shapirobacteria bacterium CG10_big_fil_rev_8_21_14_0_10_38_14]
MTRLSPIKVRKLIKFLKNKGFYEVRQKGSHKFFAHTDGRTTVIPFHPTKEISRGLLRKILDDIKSSPKELKK